MSPAMNIDGTIYRDCLSLPLRDYRPQRNGSIVRLTQVDIDRFDIYIDKYYNSLDYIDIILWLNNVSSVRELSAGDFITLPAKSDLNTFFINNRI